MALPDATALAPLPAFPLQAGARAAARRLLADDAAAHAAAAAAAPASPLPAAPADTPLVASLRAAIAACLSRCDLRHIDGLSASAQSFLESLVEHEFALFRATLLHRHARAAAAALRDYAAHEARMAVARVFPAAVNAARVRSAADTDRARRGGRLHLPTLAGGVVADMLAAAAAPGGLAAHVAPSGVLRCHAGGAGGGGPSGADSGRAS
jgi:hypothetical protein